MSRAFYIIVAICLVLTAGAVAFRAFVSAGTDQESIYVPRKEVITPEIELLRRYVRIDTSNPPGLETAGARFLLDYLAANGVRGELIEAAPNRGNVYARIKGRNSDQGLLLLHHIDVVPAASEGWTRPPFAADVLANQLWGRGSLDMKSIGVCHLLAFVELAKSGRVPARDILFLATADEESGGAYGIAWLLQNRPEIFAGVRYAINEGGTTEMKEERVSYFGVEVGSKLFTKIRLRAEARQPLEEARIVLEPSFQPHDPETLLPEIREYFKAVAPYRVELADLYADIDETIAQGRFWNLPAPYRALTQNNLIAFGIVEEEQGFRMDVVLQNLPTADQDMLLERFRRRMETLPVSMEVVQKMEPTRIVPTSTPLFEAIQDSVRAEFGNVPVGPAILVYGTTDCRYLRSRGVDCYGLFPFPVDFFQTKGIHSIDERVTLDRFLQGVSLTRRLVNLWADPS